MPDRKIAPKKALVLQRTTYASLILLIWAFAAMALISGYYEYSVIPYADAWHGYLGFYNELSKGNLSLWWAQHNEHRIIVARILFWLDLHFLKGTTPILVILNYFFSISIGLIFWKICEKTSIGFSKLTIISFLLIPSLSLVQIQNLYLPFQGQFILAYLLPLASFYMLTISAIRPEQQRWFYGACLTGVVSAGTMANGLLALPVLALLSVTLKLQKQKTLIIATLATLIFFLYFSSYQPPVKNNSIPHQLLSNSVDFIHFLLLYLGSPFHYIFQASNRPAAIAGAVVIFLSITYFIRALRSKEPLYFEWILIAFVAFVGGGALASTLGRLGLGLEQAVTSRYCTPVIWAWTALAILSFSPKIGLPRYKKLLAILSAFIFLLFLAYQGSVIAKGKPEQRLFSMKAATLALQFQIKDTEIFRTISLDKPERLLKNAQGAKSLSAFTLDEFIKAKNYLGRKVYVSGVIPECSANINAFYTLDTDKSYNRIEGWAFDATSGAPPSRIIAVSQTNEVIGYAIVGHIRKDIVHLTGEAGLRSGFFGYIKSGTPPQNIRLIGLKPNCIISPTWPDTFTQDSPPIHTTPETECPASIDSLALSGKNLEVKGWVAGNIYTGGAPQKLILNIKSKNTDTNIPVTLSLRTDVNKHFEKPDMGPVGFSISVDLPVTNAPYKLSFIRKYRNKWEQCSNINRTLLQDRTSGP